MRISTSQFNTIGVNSILDQQNKVSKTQVQVASGKRITLPSDDPVGTSQMLSLQKTLDVTKQYQANATSAVNRLTHEDGVLEEVNNVLQRARELSVAGMNATQTNESRRAYASEIRQLLDQAVGLANTRDGTGDFLFSGSKAGTLPFALSGGVYDYFGDQTQRKVQVSPGHQIPDGDPGSTVFQLIRNGNGTFVTEPGGNTGGGLNQGTGVIDAGSVVDVFAPSITPPNNGYTVTFGMTGTQITYQVFDSAGVAIDLGNPPVAGVTTANYTSGTPIEFAGARVIVTGTPAVGDTFTVKSSENQDIFTTLQNLVDALETPVTSTASKAAQQNALNRVLTDIDQGMENISNVRASVGARINAIDSQQNINDNQTLQATQVLSSIKDLDYASAISQLNQQTAGLQAAQMAYQKVSSLSLFNYLK